MKKYSIIVAVTAACLALLATVWPQPETTEETPAPLSIIVVSNSEPTVEDAVGEAEIPAMPEEEMVNLPQAELPSEVTPDSEPEPMEIAAASEVHPTSESEPEQESVPAPIPSPTPSQAVADPQPGDMVYVPGFGWLECQGPGEVIHDESIYENGNKIGVMG